MIVMKPWADQTVWGGKRLAPYADGRQDGIGHLYSAFCAEGGSNAVLNGEFAGGTLDDYFLHVRERFGLGGYPRFPLVIALVDARENLSIQVHPDDETARLLSGGALSGKCESWYFLSDPDEGSIFAGCGCRTLDEVRTAVLEGRMEEVTGRLPVRQGDYVYVPAGTLPALSAGSLVYEIEENAGCTFRFHDFGRRDRDGNPRKLHIPEALFSLKPGNRILPRRYEGGRIRERLYATEPVRGRDRYRNGSDTLQAATLLSGEGTAGGIRIRTGHTVLLEPGDVLDVRGLEIMVAEPVKKP